MNDAVASTCYVCEVTCGKSVTVHCCVVEKGNERIRNCTMVIFNKFFSVSDKTSFSVSLHEVLLMNLFKQKKRMDVSCPARPPSPPPHLYPPTDSNVFRICASIGLHFFPHNALLESSVRQPSSVLMVGCVFLFPLLGSEQSKLQ